MSTSPGPGTLVQHFYERAGQYWLLMRFHRPIGIFLLLWPALWALWIAGQGYPDPFVAAVIAAGVVLMRAAGCVINDYADRDFDPRVARTRERPIAAGRVAPREALALFVTLCLIAFALVLQLNRMTAGLSLVALCLAALYPYTKRHMQLPQLFLGLAFGWAVPMVFAAQTHSLPLASWLLYLATVLWALAYDTMYAIADREDDLKIGVKSTAILFGEHDRLIIGVFQTLVLVILAGVGLLESLAWPYYPGLVLAAGLAVHQQRLIRQRQPQDCLKAFLNNNWFGAAVFAGVLGSYLLPPP